MGESVVESLDDYIAEMDDSDGWPTLFTKLLQQAVKNQSPCLVAKEAESKTRNRYRDVLPADDSRVTLDSQDDESDYINANFVEVADVGRKYILTQGPLPHTAEHFWQMVWEQKSKGVAMLNRVIEKGMRKCHQYFPTRDAAGPDGASTLVSFGPFNIRLVDSEDKGGFVINKLSLENRASEEPAREVLHFHYRKWPDFHLPDTAEDFLDYLWALRNSGCLDADVGSLVVHCSAGIGRSGTLILVDVCLKEIEMKGDLQGAKIEEYLQLMRKQRFGLIQTPEQLRFAYLAIAEGIERVDVPSQSEPAAAAKEDDEAETVSTDDQPSSKGSEAMANVEDDTTAAVAQPPCKRQAEEDPSFGGDQPPPKRRTATAANSSLNGGGQALSSGRADTTTTSGGDDHQSGPTTLATSASGMRSRGARSPELGRKVDEIKENLRAHDEARSCSPGAWSSYIKWSVAAVVVVGGAYVAYRRYLA